jgi:hypothetical protein
MKENLSATSSPRAVATIAAVPTETEIEALAFQSHAWEPALPVGAPT